MFATLIAIGLSIYLYFYGAGWSPGILFPFSVASSSILLSFGAAALLVSFLPVQKGEQNITPRLSELFRKDYRINLGMAFLFCLPLLMVAASFLASPLIPILLLLGLGIDTLYLLIRRIMDYLNPFRVIDFLKAEAFTAIDQNADGRLCNGIEACAEVAIKSVQRHNGTLANHALDALEGMGENFLAASKRAGQPIQSPELKAEGINDSLSYVLLFLIQQLEAIYSSALEKKMELVAGHVITALTKLAIYTTHTDLSLTSLPLHYLDKLTQQAMEKGFKDIGIKASIGLMSVADAIGGVKEIQYLDIKPAFVKIITTLDMIAKETFKKDKSTKMALLIHPFKELADLINKEPLASHQDRGAIESQLTLVLSEFEALASVLSTMPFSIPPDE